LYGEWRKSINASRGDKERRHVGAKCGTQVPDGIDSCPWCGQAEQPLIPTNAIAEEATESVSFRRAARIVYCTRCGLQAGRPDKRARPGAHHFVHAGPDCLVVYCKNCAVTPGQATKCLVEGDHSFIQAVAFYSQVYCERCGLSPGLQHTCLDEVGHAFVEIEPDQGYCPVCGALNPAERVFTCQKCERSFVCRSHADPRWQVCAECAAGFRHEIVEVDGVRRCRTCGFLDAVLKFSNIDTCGSHDVIGRRYDSFCRKCGRTTIALKPLPPSCYGQHDVANLSGTRVCITCGEISSIYDAALDGGCIGRHIIREVGSQLVCERCGKTRPNRNAGSWHERCID